MTKRAEERFKERMELDWAKIESLEAELARMREEKKKYEETLPTKDTALATSESSRQQVFETLVSIEH